MEQETRKLIKFSNYSLCVTLPKSLIRSLKWEKGDLVQMIVDEKKGEILVKRPTGTVKSQNNKKAPEKPVKTKSTKKSRW